MRQNVIDFIQEGKARISADAKKQAVEREKKQNLLDAAQKNSVFRQYRHVDINKSERVLIQQCVDFLRKSREESIAALACLEGFNQFNKRELLLAVNYIDANIYMLSELLNQQKSTLNNAAFERGLIAGVFES